MLIQVLIVFFFYKFAQILPFTGCVLEYMYVELPTPTFEENCEANCLIFK